MKKLVAAALIMLFALIANPTSLPNSLMFGKFAMHPHIIIAVGPPTYIARYELDGNANDSSGNGHNGTLHGSSYAFVTGEDSIANHAIDLSGANGDYVDCGAVAVPNTGFSVSAWVFPTAFSGLNMYVSKGYDGSTVEFELYADGSGFVHFDMYNGALHGVTSTSTLTTGAWYFLTGTYDGSTWKIYINGTLSSSVSDLNAPTDNGLHIGLGARLDSSSPFALSPGDIDDAGIYSGALTLPQINVLYMTGAQ